MPQDNDITDAPWNISAGGDYTTFQNLADLGSGIGANFVGQPYDVYRITVSGNVVQMGNQIFAGYPVQREKLSGKDSQGLETTIAQKAFFFSLLGDFSLNKVGDVFIQNDPTYGVGSTIVDFPTLQFAGFFLGIHPVLQKPIAIRLDRFVQIYRPTIEPDVDGYFDQTVNGSLPLIISNGVASLGEAGDLVGASLIPAGFMPDKRSGQSVISDYTKNMPPKTNWSIALPPIPVSSTDGNAFFSIREGDRIISQEGDRYVVINPMRQDVGLVGYQLTAEREIAQPGGS